MQVRDVEPATIKVGTLVTFIWSDTETPRSHLQFRAQTLDRVSNQTRREDLASREEKE